MPPTVQAREFEAYCFDLSFGRSSPLEAVIAERLYLQGKKKWMMLTPRDARDDIYFLSFAVASALIGLVNQKRRLLATASSGIWEPF